MIRPVRKSRRKVKYLEESNSSPELSEHSDDEKENIEVIEPVIEVKGKARNKRAKAVSEDVWKKEMEHLFRIEERRIRDPEDNILQLNKYFPFPASEGEEDRSLLFVALLDLVKLNISVIQRSDAEEGSMAITTYAPYFNFPPKTVVLNDATLIKEIQKQYEDEIFAKTNSRCQIETRCHFTSKHYSQNENSTFEWMKGFVDPSFKFVMNREEKVIYVYLNQDSEVKWLQAVSKPLFCKFLRDSYFDGYIRDGSMQKTPLYKYRLSDTFDYPEAQISDGFQLQLRDYQLRTISWMKQIESFENTDNNCILNTLKIDDDLTGVKLQFGDYSDEYLDLSKKKLTPLPCTKKAVPVRIFGGILADDTGSGKTITCLGLVHSCPFTREHAAQRNNKKLQKIFSRATLVLCPSNLYQQWINEAKKCNPNFKIVGIATILQHRKVSWRDVIEADLVIVSYHFLVNQSYISFKNGAHGPYYFDEIWKENLEKAGNVDLHNFQFYRVMYDEFHEMESKSDRCLQQLKGLSADYYWGITGTPKFKSSVDISEILPYLHYEHDYEIFKENNMSTCEFLLKFVKRNEPNLQLPALTQEIVWVDADPTELALMNVMAKSNDTAQRIMMCSHYQISEKVTSVVGEKILTLDEIRKKLMKSRQADVKFCEAEVERAITSLAYYEATAETLEESRLASYKRAISQSEVALGRAQSQFNFFQFTLKLFDGEQIDCNICHDSIQNVQVAILPCAHFFCYGCVESFIRAHRSCPMCRLQVSKTEMYVMKYEKRDEKAYEETNKTISDALASKNVDVSKFGSKLKALYFYLTGLFESDPNARVILFLQYSNLANFISESLNELKVKHVRVRGNVYQRRHAIESFTNSDSVRLIMLSSEDSVSGINLTQATHVILLHPFWTGKGEASDLAYEKQGIARAYRGGLTHPLKVVRFAVRSTIEEELTLQRQEKYNMWK